MGELQKDHISEQDSDFGDLQQSEVQSQRSEFEFEDDADFQNFQGYESLPNDVQEYNEQNMNDSAFQEPNPFSELTEEEHASRWVCINAFRNVYKSNSAQQDKYIQESYQVEPFPWLSGQNPSQIQSPLQNSNVPQMGLSVNSFDDNTTLQYTKKLFNDLINKDKNIYNENERQVSKAQSWKIPKNKIQYNDNGVQVNQGLEMDQIKVDKILDLMQGIELTYTPKWARGLSEQSWEGISSSIKKDRYSNNRK